MKFAFRLRSNFDLFVTVIASTERLAGLLEKIRSADWIALDTEADSLHAYPEKLCLLQISLPTGDDLIDPLAGLDLSPVFELLHDRELILHGADYDLRLLHRTFHFVPHKIFDTMWAARLVGQTEFGLVHLAARLLGVTLEKGPQKMNWARRPLTERMEAYARNDTRYLLPLARLLKDELIKLGRLEWHEEVCRKVIAECTQPKTMDVEAWRIKGSDRLDRFGLAVLRELWRWREKEAIAANKPPFFVLSHEKLVGLAAHVSKSPELPMAFPKMLPARTARLEAAIKRGLAVPASHYPERAKRRPQELTPSQTRHFEQLKQRRDQHAAELGLDATLLASRAELMAVAKGKDPSKLLMNWQRRFLTG